MGDRYERALRALDAANAADPNLERVAGGSRPKELVYAERMTAWLDRLYPDASEALRLAVRAQHLERWVIPRDAYPEGRQAYKEWRTALAGHHARRAGEILSAAGYDAATIGRVQALLRKEKLKVDPEAQALEDVACVVFLEGYFEDFARRYVDDEAKILAIVRRTWIKMSPVGHAAALALPLAPPAAAIVQKALSSGE